MGVVAIPAGAGFSRDIVEAIRSIFDAEVEIVDCEKACFEGSWGLFDIEKLLISMYGIVPLSRGFMGILFDEFMREAGDPITPLYVRANVNDDYMASAVSGAKLVIIDDVRALPFIRLESMPLRVKVGLPCCGSMAYTKDSIVLVSSRREHVSEVLKLSDEGLRPMLTIVACPTLDEDGMRLKEEVMSRGIPAIVVHGSRGGPHVGGLILNALFKLKFARWG